MKRESYSKDRFFTVFFLLFVALGNSLNVCSQELYPVTLSDRLWHNEQRKMRYSPDGEDFVITNGDRLFTRALYGTNTGFRVETGDRPEFALYMPGMGGNLKLGIATDDISKWLTGASQVTSRYRAGSRLYSIKDSLLGEGTLFIDVLAMADADGLVLKIRLENTPQNIKLIFAFGGASGKKFSRDGDMGVDPESVFYLTPENCAGNSYAIGKGEFLLRYGTNQALQGTVPEGMALWVADASGLNSPLEFCNSPSGKAPAIAGLINTTNGKDYFITVHNPATKSYLNNYEASEAFLKAEERRKELSGRVVIKTPDPYINTIGGALAMASDAIWEEPSYLHGAIGWRTRLNGWRGAYTADALGWHDRAETHLRSYAQSQLTSPVSGPVVADTANHLARSLEKLGIGMFTSGYITRDPLGKNPRAHHYDMNLVYIDQLLRHYDWTGDIEFVKETWPVLKRHLEWETRNFDPDGDGLYDAYAAIWASDALQYSGGGVTHSSAYNYYAYKKAAEIASLLGEDPDPFRKQSEKILNAMNSILWMPEKGTYAEFKDALGNRLLHPSAALWTVYHSMDSRTMDPFQAYQIMRYVDNEIPHIPVRAEGLEDKGYYTVSTTSWMPYIWSLNDVALAESAHTILANWQAGRNDEAFKLFKSEILAFMYLGGSPGNVGQISYYSNRERYRDFADPVGIFSRALVEGLFGIVPDLLNHSLTIRPGLPYDWDFASFSQPDISFDFRRTGSKDVYTITPHFTINPDIKLQVRAQGQVKSITVNGRKTAWKNLDISTGLPVIEIALSMAEKHTVEIVWKGDKPALPSPEKTLVRGEDFTYNIRGIEVKDLYDPQKALADVRLSSSGFSAKAAGSHNNTLFLKVKQGMLIWWMPVCFRTEDAVTIIPKNNDEASNRSFNLRNNTSGDISLTVNLNSFSKSVTIPSGQSSELIEVPEESLTTGTNPVILKLSNGTIVKGSVIDWTSTTKEKTEFVDLSSFFNDKVTQIFRNKYLTPRPQTTTLQLPWQGAGSWTGTLLTYGIDDSGLRKLAGSTNAIRLPQGIGFSTPGDQERNNIIFTSQWDNYPRECTVPLSGSSTHAWFLLAGSTNQMQSQMDNGALIVEYTDGTTQTLLLRNPETWWPIQEDYFYDGFAFRLKQARPVRIHLKTGAVIVPDEKSIIENNGRRIDGGAATVLDMPLDASKTLKKVTLKTLCNDVVIGLMAITLAR